MAVYTQTLNNGYLSFPQAKHVGNPSKDRFRTSRNDGKTTAMRSALCALRFERFPESVRGMTEKRQLFDFIHRLYIVASHARSQSVAFRQHPRKDVTGKQLNQESR